MIKVTLPNGIEIQGENKDDLREIFSFIETKEEKPKEKVYLAEVEYKVWCAISDFPGSHSGQVAEMLRMTKTAAASTINALKTKGIVKRRDDGHYGWVITNDFEIAGAVNGSC